jgi:hypothetical protein
VFKLFVSQLEHEILRKSFNVSFNGLVERLCFNAVQSGKVLVQHHFLSSKEMDSLENCGFGRWCNHGHQNARYSPHSATLQAYNQCHTMRMLPHLEWHVPDKMDNLLIIVTAAWH